MLKISVTILIIGFILTVITFFYSIPTYFPIPDATQEDLARQADMAARADQWFLISFTILSLGAVLTIIQLIKQQILKRKVSHDDAETQS